MDETRKYDWTRRIAAEAVSPSLIIRSLSTPEVSRDCMRSSGSAVVLLKHIAGTVLAGNLKALFNTQPKAIDESV